MKEELECSICDADILLERGQKTGDLIVCSYCQVTFKLVKGKDKWILTEDFDE
jgi:hypothetical protein